LGCVKGFGGAGSLAVSDLITKVLEGLPLRLTGYCGLMLAVCEDQVGRSHIDVCENGTTCMCKSAGCGWEPRMPVLFEDHSMCLLLWKK
jgi:hypothetical protein